MGEFDRLDQYFLNNTNRFINQAPAGVSQILDTLWRQGHECYLVGGATRDLLLGYAPKDWDLVTSASAEEMKQIFPGAKTVGTAFEVMLIEKEGIEVQVARYRPKEESLDMQCPGKGTFIADLSTDLQRRDFTINALAISRYESIRMYSTLEDMNEGIIRAVGEPAKRFLEDPLRMLRAIRLAGKFGFKIHSETWEAMRANAALIQKVPAERVQEELNHILLCTFWDEPRKSLNRLRETGLLQFIVPELDHCYGIEQGRKRHRYDVFTHQLEAVMQVPPRLEMRLAALFHDLGKPWVRSAGADGIVHFYKHEFLSAEYAGKWLKKFKYGNDLIDEVVYLIRHHMDLINPPEKDGQIRRLLARHGYDRLQKLIELNYADRMASGVENRVAVESETEQLMDWAHTVNELKPPVKYDDLAVDGTEIMEILQMKPGVEIGAIKNALLSLVLADPEKNTKATLTAYLNRYKNGDKEWMEAAEKGNG